MSRYINIDPILEWCGRPEVFEPYGVNSVELQRKIRQAPSIDIVHCKECIHFHYDKPYIIKGIPVLGHEVCDFWGDGCKTNPNGFCSYGERK